MNQLTKKVDYQLRLLGTQLPHLYAGNIQPFCLCPKWAVEWFKPLDIAYIGKRHGEEADYIILFTRNMDKFHETYLAE